MITQAAAANAALRARALWIVARAGPASILFLLAPDENLPTGGRAKVGGVAGVGLQVFAD